MKQPQFNFRAFTTLMLSWAFITLVISGSILYIAPPGRIANWTAWQLGYLGKDQWQAIHTLTAILFVIGSLFHLLKFNWTQFAAYLRKKMELGNAIRYEMLTSLILFLLIISGTVARQVPFQTVMNFGASMRESWEPAGNPPIPHMEEMSLSQLSDSLKVDAQTLVKSLDQRGLKPIGKEDRLIDIARRNHQSPEKIYAAVTISQTPISPPENSGHSEQGTGVGQGGGLGQGFRTLVEIADQYGLSVDPAIQKLAAKGIAAGKDDRIRDIASRNGIRPYEVLAILQAEPK
jgi:hypothetical protein